MVAMRDHRTDIKPTLKHDRHFVPRLVHLATINAFDREHVEDDLVPINRYGFRWNAEHGNLPPVSHVVQHTSERIGVARHLHTHIEPFGHPKLFLDGMQILLSHINRQRSAPTCEPTRVAKGSHP